MKKLTHATALTAAALALATQPCIVSASTMVEMQVLSTITPAACTPTLSGGGVADYGVISARTLKPGTITALPEKSLSFTITCDAAANVSVRAIDNRPNWVVAGILSTGSGNGALNDSFNFSLGGSGGKSVGGYAIVFQPASYTGDNQQTQLLYSTDNGATWQPSAGGFISKNRSFGWGTPGSNKIAAWRNISGTLTVQPFLNKPENLSFSQDILLDGSATLELTYL